MRAKTLRKIINARYDDQTTSDVNWALTNMQQNYERFQTDLANHRNTQAAVMEKLTVLSGQLDLLTTALQGLDPSAKS